MNADKQPVSLILLSFLCLDPKTAIEYFEVPVPSSRGVWRNPINQLLNALGVYWEFFFDYYPRALEADTARKRFQSCLARIGRDKLDSKDDFVDGDAWGELRSCASSLLNAAKVDPPDIHDPLPFDQWIDLRIDRESYDEYVTYMQKVCPQQTVVPFE